LKPMLVAGLAMARLSRIVERAGAALIMIFAAANKAREALFLRCSICSSQDGKNLASNGNEGRGVGSEIPLGNVEPMRIGGVEGRVGLLDDSHDGSTTSELFKNEPEFVGFIS